MSEKGRESLQDRYARIKRNGLQEFEKEMTLKGIDDDLKQLMHHYCDEYYGCVPTQELMMMMLMEENFANFSLAEANSARKIVAKKKMDEIPKLKEQVFSRFKDKEFATYFWEIVVQPSLGYAFSINHSLPYSFVGLQTIELANKFDPIYWNTACLIVNTGSLSEENNESTDYSKLAKAIGDIRERGISVSLADINKSNFKFKPDIEHNTILFGLKGMNQVGTEVVNQIIENRPYSSFYDFLRKTNIPKQPMISLIKGGAFDCFGDRRKIMVIYIWLTCKRKKELNLRNLGQLIKEDLVPTNLSKQQSIFEFTRYLKACCKYDDEYYLLDERAMNFYLDNYSYDDLICNDNQLFLNQKFWDKIYQKEMDYFRNWIRENHNLLLDTINRKAFLEDWNKYATGSISAWEMESLCFYYHDHELKNLDCDKYGIVNFKDLPEEPPVIRYQNWNGRQIPIYEIQTIAGTCLAKDKTKSTVTLLTTSGVVNVKFRKEYFSLFDRQISEKQDDGTKKVKEKSWFGRGNKIIVKGIRRGDDFIVKKYSSTPGHQLYKINSINESTGEIEITSSRYGEENEEE